MGRAGGADAWTPHNAYGYMWIANPPKYAPGYTNFQTWLLHTGTPLGPTNSVQWSYAMADWNRDGSADLIGIKMNNTGSGMTEVHIMSGASYFSNFGPLNNWHFATALGATDSTFWAFAMGDYNQDGTPDLIVIKKQEATSTEVHALSGPRTSPHLAPEIRGTTQPRLKRRATTGASSPAISTATTSQMSMG